MEASKKEFMKDIRKAIALSNSSKVAIISSIKWCKTVAAILDVYDEIEKEFNQFKYLDLKYKTASITVDHIPVTFVTADAVCEDDPNKVIIIPIA